MSYSVFPVKFFLFDQFVQFLSLSYPSWFSAGKSLEDSLRKSRHSRLRVNVSFGTSHPPLSSVDPLSQSDKENLSTVTFVTFFKVPENTPFYLRKVPFSINSFLSSLVNYFHFITYFYFFLVPSLHPPRLPSISFGSSR